MESVKSVVSKLNTACHEALQEAAKLCLSMTHYEVDIEHFLIKVLQRGNTDLDLIFQHFGLRQSRVEGELTQAIEGFKRGNARTPALSPRTFQLIGEAWLIASAEYSAEQVRSGHVLLALLRNRELGQLLRQTSPELELVSAEKLARDMNDIAARSEEASEPEQSAESPASGETPGPSATKALDKFTVDLSLRARQGLIDPVKEREFEIRQVIDILMRRRQNNPILTGEAGVGKTAVVEGLALCIAEGSVPPPLKNVSLRTLDLGSLQAGAGIRGEFENRLKSVIAEVTGSPRPIILFIDEAHTMIGAGGQAGHGDAANLLKPALARGELRTIAATTWAEYKKYFEKDAALARRFQPVKIEEPTPEQAVVMMRHLASRLEEHHGVRILDEGVEAAVRLSDRYISGRQLPDKAVSVLDTAAARLALGQSAIPGPVEDCRRRLTNLELEERVLTRENLASQEHQERLEELAASLQQTRREMAQLEDRWERERELIEELRQVRHAIEAQAPGNGARQGQDAGSAALAAESAADRSLGEGAHPQVASDGGSVAVVEDPSPEARRAELERLNAELAALQGDDPLMQPVVNSQTVAEVISGWTGIPVGKMMRDEIETVLELADRLEQRVKGQSHALRTIAKRIQTSKARLEDPKKPIGVFLLVGPSGVGKTETALALADTLYGGEHKLITINMSEYQEAHTVSGLKGSPPGYVGYGEGGILTEAVRRKPYSVVLLDEVEKAHPDVLELFFQVFDKGWLEDAEGREIDFRNTVILLTSNVGTDQIMALCADEETRPEPDALIESLRPELLKHFAPAFLGRLVSIAYYPIADEVMQLIIELKLGRVIDRFQRNHRADLSFDQSLVDAVRARCTDVDSGARNVDNILTQTLLPEISRRVLTKMAHEEEIRTIGVTADESGQFRYRFE